MCLLAAALALLAAQGPDDKELAESFVPLFNGKDLSGWKPRGGKADVWKVEGTINLFRSPGFWTLHGLENLQLVEGSLFVHLNGNLTSVAALARLRTVTGNLGIFRNPKVPQTEVDAIGARVEVGGTKQLSAP